MSSDKKQITVLIVDDEPLARAYIRGLLQSDTEIEIVGEAGDGATAGEFIRARQPHLIFLDVQMPEMDGFALLKTLDAGQLPAIIFTTAFAEYAVRAFEFHALDYLLKPFDAERFNRAVERAKARLRDSADAAQDTLQIAELLKNVEASPRFLERLLIKQNGRIVFLKVDEIDFIKSDDKYVQIFAGRQSHLVRQTLSAMKNGLDSRRFVQVHRSAIVNVEKIKELQPQENGEYLILLESGLKIAVSRNFKDDLFAVLGTPL